ncbi:MAG: trypsin-like serine protease, partial [Singulisphaera sp.]
RCPVMLIPHSHRTRINKARRGFWPAILDRLEDRIVPVLGAFDVPTLIASGAGLDGVVEFGSNANARGCTGTLLNTGRHILTAAHCVDGDGDNVPNQAQYFVRFDLAGGPVTLTVPSANVAIHPDWDGEVKDGNDVAILTLDELAPSGQDLRLCTYTTNDEAGKAYATAGYGATGTGTTGDNSQADVGRTEHPAFENQRGIWSISARIQRAGGNPRLQRQRRGYRGGHRGFDGVIDAEVR